MVCIRRRSWYSKRASAAGAPRAGPAAAQGIKNATASTARSERGLVESGSGADSGVGGGRSHDRRRIPRSAWSSQAQQWTTPGARQRRIGAASRPPTLPGSGLVSVLGVRGHGRSRVQSVYPDPNFKTRAARLRAAHRCRLHCPGKHAAGCDHVRTVQSIQAPGPLGRSGQSGKRAGATDNRRSRLARAGTKPRKPRKRGAFYAPKRTRTSTGKSPHKALNLARLPIPPPAQGRR
ncbi:MAG: hypothetical protein QOH29_1856 [Actinomycetota bacterium]|nr:hypothetical protein [Actinomycetota bacterium]